MLIKRREEIKDKYDVIVIGGGIGGLAAANILGRNGQKVLLVEAHRKLGGLASWFKRQGDHIFDISLHGFPQGMVKSCRKYFGKEIADNIVQLQKLRFKNPVYDIETDFTREDFSRILVEKFEIAPKTVQEFFDFVFHSNFYDNLTMTNRELFEKFFPGRNDVMRFLLEPIVYANGSNLDDEAITYAIVFGNFMKKGVYTYRGGTDHFIKTIQKLLIQNGVDILLGEKVENINIENEQVKSVSIKGNDVKAKAVLSNGNLLSTIFNMVGTNHFSSDFIDRAKRVRLNTSSTQVYLGLKKGESIPFVGDLIFTSQDSHFATDLLLKPNTTYRTFSFYYPELRPERKDAPYEIVASMNARYDDWANLSPEEMQSAKEQMIEDSLNTLEQFLPGIRTQIDYIEAATPLTIERYTHHQKGASFGTKFEGLDVSQKISEEIKGLFHAGSVGIIMSGWLGALNYGAIKTNDIESYLNTFKD